jgi:hypothetical protein
LGPQPLSPRERGRALRRVMQRSLGEGEVRKKSES